MKSFGLWYQEVSKETSLEKVEKDELLKTVENKPQFSLHVNFWSLEDVKLKSPKSSRTIKTPILDIGIKIKNYSPTNMYFCI